MAGDTIITIIGNLTADPEVRFTPSGAGVASFTVASTPRVFDRQAGEYKDGETLFMRCSIWREAAENVAESLKKGMRVIVQGRLVQRSFTTREGENRTVVEMQVDEIGPSLRYAKAQVTRQSPQQGGQNQGGNFGGNSQQGNGGFGGQGQQGGQNQGNQNQNGFGGGNQGGPQQGGNFGGNFGGNQNQGQNGFGGNSQQGNGGFGGQGQQGGQNQGNQNQNGFGGGNQGGPQQGGNFGGNFGGNQVADFGGEPAF